MIALIDADIVAYRVSAASEDTDEAICLLRCDKQMHDLLYLTESTGYKAFLTGDNNFRKDIYSEYKANRKDKPKPKYLQLCREFLCSDWNATVSDGCEADDLLGCAQTDNTVICSIDKDLLQIAGSHYNWVKNESYVQTVAGGIRFFYQQLLMGDKADNIPGVRGLGEVKAKRFLEGCETEQELFETCQGLYNDDALMDLYGKLLWIWRYEGDIWDADKVKTLWTGENQSGLEKDQVSCSTTQKVVETNLSTEHITRDQNGYPLLGL